MNPQTQEGAEGGRCVARQSCWPSEEHLEDILGLPLTTLLSGLMRPEVGAWSRKAGKRMFVSLQEGDFSVSLVDRKARPACQWEGKTPLLWELTCLQSPCPRPQKKGQKQPVRGLRGPYGHKAEDREAPSRGPATCRCCFSNGCISTGPSVTPVMYSPFLKHF